MREKEQHNILKSSSNLLKEAETKRANAINDGDFDQIGIGHGLLKARKRMDNATAELCSCSIAAKHKKHS